MLECIYNVSYVHNLTLRLIRYKLHTEQYSVKIISSDMHFRRGNNPGPICNVAVIFVLSPISTYEVGKLYSQFCIIPWYASPCFGLCSYVHTWWRHQMETISALLALCAGNSPVTGEFPSQRPVTRSFDVVFDLRLNKRLIKRSRRWWFETPSRSLWRHCNERNGLYRTKQWICLWNIKMYVKLLEPTTVYLKAMRFEPGALDVFPQLFPMVSILTIISSENIGYIHFFHKII